jgi:hypothetical protein
LQLLHLKLDSINYSCFSREFFLSSSPASENQVAPMSASSNFLISREDEMALHKRLVDGDVTASAEIAKVFYEALIKWLIGNNSSKIPEDLCVEAAGEAWLALVKNPASFKPEQGKRLGQYLCMSAQGDLRNLLRKEGRQRGKSLESVQLSAKGRKYLETVDEPSLSLRIEEEAEQAERGIIPIVRNGLTESESRVLDLM